MVGKMGTKRGARGLFLVMGRLQDRDRPVIRPPEGPELLDVTWAWGLLGSALKFPETINPGGPGRPRQARRRRETWSLISQAEPRASMDGFPSSASSPTPGCLGRPEPSTRSVCCRSPDPGLAFPPSVRNGDKSFFLPGLSSARFSK